MANLGELRARITAELDEFERGMDSATQKTSEFGDSTQKAGRDSEKGTRRASGGLRSMSGAAKAAAAAGAAAAAALAKMTQEGLAAADEHAKLARQLGLTNEELTELELAADLAGVSSRRLVRSTERLDRELLKSEDGSGRAAEALQEIGLKVSDLEDLNPQERISEISNAMQGLDSHTRKAGVAQEIFGSRAGEMMRLLDDADAAFDKAGGAAERYGLTLDDSEYTAIENANDALTILSEQTSMAAQKMAANLAPAIQAVAESISGMIGKVNDAEQEIEDFFEQKFDISTEDVEQSITFIQALFRATRGEVGETTEALSELSDQAAGDTWGPFLDELENGFRAVRLEGDDLIKVAEAMPSELDIDPAERMGLAEVQSSTQDIIEELESAGVEAGAFANQLRNMEGAPAYYEQIAEAIDHATGASEDFRDMQQGTVTDGEQERAAAWYDLQQEREEAAAKATKEAQEKIEEAYESTAQGRIEALQDEIGTFKDMRSEHENYREEINAIIAKRQEEMESLRSNNDEQRELMKERLDNIRQNFMSEAEIATAEYEKRRGTIKDAYEQEIIDKQEHNELLEQLEKNHQAKMNEIEKQNLSQKEKFQQQSWHSQTATVLGEMANMTSGLDRENKTQFYIMQAGALARAAVNTYEGVSKTLSAYPQPLAGILAAGHLAAGLAQVHNIANQSYGNGASGSSGGGGGGGSSASDTGGGTQMQGVIRVEGISGDEMFSGDALGGLIDRISEAQEDGYKVVR